MHIAVEFRNQIKKTFASNFNGVTLKKSKAEKKNPTLFCWLLALTRKNFRATEGEEEEVEKM